MSAAAAHSFVAPVRRMNLSTEEIAKKIILLGKLICGVELYAYQYAFAFLLIAIAAYAISRYLRKGLSRVPDSNWVKAIVFLTVAQGAAAGAGIVFLLVAGKVGTARADWAANNIFLAAAVGILLMSLAGLPGLFRAMRLN